jgi:hypothetical protein
MDGEVMTKDETIKQLIEDLISAMEYHVEQTRPVHMTTVAIQAAKDALNSMPTAPVQDQIRAITQEAMQKIYDLEDRVRREVYNIPPNVATPLAAQRQWVGLTDEQIEKVWQRVQANDFHDCVQPFAQAIEAKLKEKNSD